MYIFGSKYNKINTIVFGRNLTNLAVYYTYIIWPKIWQTL